MKKRIVLLVLIGIIAIFVFTSCDILREPWPASEGYEPAVVDQLPDEGTEDEPATRTPDGTALPTGAPTIDPDYNG